MPTPRAYGTAVQVSGILYVIGGYAWAGPSAGLRPTAVVEAYDPITKTWTAKAPMPTARYGLGAAAIDGVIYAIGGLGNSELWSVNEAYDPSTDLWTTRASMPTRRFMLGVTAIGGRVYAVGGGTTQNGEKFDLLEVYHPALNRWTTGTPMPGPRFALAVAAVRNTLYAIGGQTAAYPATGIVEAYRVQ
jgi:N-acetylneuraminic acid mutarotase